MKHVMFAISTLFGGGAESVVSIWANSLVQRGYKVSIMVYSRVENEYSISKGINVYPLAHSTEECDNMSILSRVWGFRQILKKIRPDVLINFLPVIQVYVNIASIGLGIPRVETIRINPWKVGITETKYGGLWKRCFINSKAVILQSSDQGDFFSEKVQKKSVVIPNPINEKYVNNTKTTYVATHRLVAAGRLNKQKNYDMMINAINIVAKGYPDVHLEIYGEGDLQQELERKILDLGLSNNISLMGRSNKLYEVYKNKDVFLMSSDYEGMPNALAEAMAMGLPCISTDCKTGPRDLIDNEVNGYLIPVGDAEAFALAIKKVFSMTVEEQQTLGSNARKKVLSFCSEDNSVNKLCSLLEKMG